MTMPLRLFGPRLSTSRNFLSDQTFQTEIISDQTFQAEINPDQIFQTQVISDQTFPTHRVCDQTFQTERVLFRPFSDHGPDSNSDHFPELNQTMIRLNCARSIYDQTKLRLQLFMIRLTRAWNRFSSDSSTLEKSDQS